MSTRQTFVTQVEARTGGAQRVPGVSSIGTYIDQCLPTFNAAAVNRGSVRIVELTITGDGTDEYSLGSDWTDEFSYVKEVWLWESNDTNDDPFILNSDEWRVETRLPSAGASQIRLLSYAPSSSDRVVVVHTALHTITDAESTMEAHDEEAFANLVAARVLEAASTALLALIPQGSDTDALLGSPQGERANGYRESARTLERRYERHFGIAADGSGDPTGGAFIAIEDYDQSPGILNHRHTHRSRRRGY